MGSREVGEVARGKVDWYGKELVMLVRDASDEILTQAAFQAEGVAKPNAPVDTGFMRNAIYGVGPTGSHRGAVPGGDEDHVAAPSPNLPEHTAALHGAAHYTIYQEIKHGFLYQSIKAVAGQIGGIIRQVGKGRFG